MAKAETKIVTDNLHWIGALDFDLRVFDVVMYTNYGTTYNAYLLETEEGVVLFETVKAKFFDDYLNKIKSITTLDKIKYIVVEHTEPDHAGSIEKMLALCPNAQVIGSQVAINFLTEICNREIPAIVVNDGDTMSLGNEQLTFLSVPFLHWPDSMYTYIHSNKSLVTCDSFGCHYASNEVFNDLIDGDFIDAYKYYFDMIMGPFKPHVQYALERIKEFDIDTICPGHGPVLRKDLQKYIDLYDKWSTVEVPAKRDKPLVVNSYVSAYGYTEEIASEINLGIKEIIDCNIESYDMVVANKEEVFDKITQADALLFGTPTVNGDALPPVADLVNSLNGILHGGKVAAAYGSYGWSGEGPDMLTARLNFLRMDTLEPALKINFKPSVENREMARNFGRRFGKKVKESWEKIGTSTSGKTLWKCTVCGEVFEGAMPPISCPICGVGSEAFIQYEEDIVSISKDSNSKFVIIGSGTAAISAAEAIRKRDKTAHIDIYTAENEYPYYRPLLTELIYEEKSDNEFYLHPKSFYEEREINFHFGVKVDKIEVSSNAIILENGQKAEYDKLLIATGAKPFVPPFKGHDLDRVRILRDKKNLDTIKNDLTTSKSAVVIGGGLLGLEAACSIAKMVDKVTVIDNAPTILPRQTDALGSSVIESLVTNSAIDVIAGVTVEEIYGHNSVEKIILSDGSEVDADFVLISAGVRTNYELAEKAGIVCDRAIVTDSQCRTNIRNIFAAGDCAINSGRYYGVWEPAVSQGTIAGATMVGEEKEFKGKDYPATLNAFGSSLFALGNLHQNESDSVQKIVSLDELENHYTALYFKNGILDGALLIGDLSKAAILTSAIEKGTVTLQDAKDLKIV